MAVQAGVLSTLKQKENLINEYKGGLFEYLVAKDLALKCGALKNFLKDFSPELQKLFFHYEQKLREMDLFLFRKLPRIASKTSTYIEKKIIQDRKISTILVIGKLQIVEFEEADLIIKYEDQNEDKNEDQSSTYISLKLCRDQSYVNTKNAGIKSFIKQYFQMYNQMTDFDCEIEQSLFNKKVDNLFYNMGVSIYNHMGEEFEGKFVETLGWKNNKLSHLPGECPHWARVIIKDYYYQICKLVYNQFNKYYTFNKDYFLKCLAPLLGLSDPKIVQVSCFHQGVNNYEIKSFSHLAWDQMDKEFEIKPLENGKSFFTINFKKYILQIRIKPMNKFTVPSVKINCSTKRSE